MKRICYVIPSLSLGGSERQLTEMVRGLTKDHEIIVVCTRYDGGLAGDVRRAGAEIIVLDMGTAWNPSIYWKLRRVFRHRRPDIVHTFLFGFDFAANLAARRERVPIVVSSRRELAAWMKKRHRMMQNWANRYVDCVVANGQAVAEYVRTHEKLDPALVRVILNGIHADSFVCRTDRQHLLQRYRIPFYRHIVGLVANFSPVKDHALFVRIAEILLKRRADLHFLMAGSGPLVRSVENLIAARGMDACFTRVATVAEIRDLYALMDVSVLCSKSEGFPNAAMEAMAAGTPVVAAAVGGIPELVQDGVTGRLVSSRRPEDFADAIDSALNCPEESAAMALRASAFVRESLSVERMVEQYRSLYAELLAARRGKGR